MYEQVIVYYVLILFQEYTNSHHGRAVVERTAKEENQERHSGMQDKEGVAAVAEHTP